MKVGYHRTQGEMFVILLQLLGRSVSIANVEIIEQEFFARLEHPIKHLQRIESIKKKSAKNLKEFVAGNVFTF